jgi:hypothetical protein
MVLAKAAPPLPQGCQGLWVTGRKKPGVRMQRACHDQQKYGRRGWNDQGSPCDRCVVPPVARCPPPDHVRRTSINHNAKPEELNIKAKTTMIVLAVVAMAAFSVAVYLPWAEEALFGNLL